MVRFGLAILPERPWSEAERQWRTAEDLGFDHAWTYDHLVWAGLPESPWYGEVCVFRLSRGLVSQAVRDGCCAVPPPSGTALMTAQFTPIALLNAVPNCAGL